MDSFSEPRRLPEVIHLGDVRTAVASLEAEHRAKGIPLSGRVLHVCHYLPITATLHSSSRPGILSPPATPPSQPSDIPPSPTDASAPTTNGTAGQDDSVLHPKWSLATRQGHAAMISGIRSLSSTHEQLIIGWTGDIESPVTSSGTFQTRRYYRAQLNWIHQVVRSSRSPRILSQRKTEQCWRRKSRTSKPKKNMARQHMSLSGSTTRSHTAIMMVIANRVSVLIRYAGAFFGDFRRCVVFLPSRSRTVFMFLEIDPLRAMKSPPLCLAIVVGEIRETNRVHIRLHPTRTLGFDELVTD